MIIIIFVITWSYLFNYENFLSLRFRTIKFLKFLIYQKIINSGMADLEV